MNRTFIAILAISTAIFIPTLHAGYSAGGSGLQLITSGDLENAALYINTAATWINGTPPAQPYTNQTSFTLPLADNIALGRLVITYWGGSAARTNTLNITVNGTSLFTDNSLTFGSTNDANPMFTLNQPNVYGSGSGVWLLTIPILPSLIYTNGTANIVTIAEDPSTFDGRINQVTFIAVYQNAALNNTFHYALAEGSGDIYNITNPATGRVDTRSVTMPSVEAALVTTATLHALYTYGDVNQNDRLYFNNTALGGSGSNDIANWNANATGLDYGPNLVSYEVTSLLASNNVVTFSVSSNDVPAPYETSLRPQLAILEFQTIPEPNAGALALLGCLSTLLFCRKKT